MYFDLLDNELVQNGFRQLQMFWTELKLFRQNKNDISSHLNNFLYP